MASNITGKKMNWYNKFKKLTSTDYSVEKSAVDSKKDVEKINIPFYDTIGKKKPSPSLVKKIERGLEDAVVPIIEQMFPNAKFLGSGAFGLVYDIGNEKVMKITNDSSEAYLAASYKNKNLKHTVKIHDIILLSDRIVKDLGGEKSLTVWGMIYEKVSPFPPKAKFVFDLEREYGYEVLSDYDHLMQKYREFFNARPSGIQKKYAKNIVEMWNYFLDNDLAPWDLSVKNLGLNSNGEIVLLDLGMLKSVPLEFSH